MTLNDLKHLIRGVSGDKEINFSVENEKGDEMTVSLSRVEVLRFAESPDSCDSVEVVFFGDAWRVNP